MPFAGINDNQVIDLSENRIIPPKGKLHYSIFKVPQGTIATPQKYSSEFTLINRMGQEVVSYYCCIKVITVIFTFRRLELCSSKTHYGESLFGIFKVAQYLSDNGMINDPEDDTRLWELFGWLGDNLSLLKRYWRSKNHRQTPRAIAWFKSSSNIHIAALREISLISQKNGAVVDFVKTNKPRYIIYEDDYQIFAEPFKN